MDHKIQVNAIVYEEEGVWIAQGVEFDIIAHAKDVGSLSDAFQRAILENILITQHLGRAPLQGIGPAPEKFRSMFESARLEMRPISHQVNSDAEVALRVA